METTGNQQCGTETEQQHLSHSSLCLLAFSSSLFLLSWLTCSITEGSSYIQLTLNSAGDEKNNYKWELADYLGGVFSVTFDPCLGPASLSSSGLTVMLLQAVVVELVTLLSRTGVLFPKSTCPDTMSSQFGCRGPGVDCTRRH